MAIGKKKKQQDQDAKASKKKESKSPDTPKATGSLLKTFLPGILGCILSVGGAFGGIYWLLVDQGGKETQASMAQAQAKSFISLISLQSLQLNNLVASTANSDKFKTPAIAGDSDTLEALEESLEQQLPGVANVEIFLAGKAKKDKNSVPPISFAQLDLITRAEKQEAPHPEIHVHEANKFLTITAAIEQDDQVLGTLIAAFDLKQITDQFPKIDNSLGYLELTQQFGKSRPTVFHGAGNSAAKSQTPVTADGPIQHWQARFYPSIATNIPAKNNVNVLAMGGGAIFLSLLFSLLSFGLVKRALAQNATKLTSTFNALTSHDKHANTYSLEIFTSLAQTIERLFIEYDAHVRHNSLKNKDMQQTSNQDLESSIDPMYQKDDVLDIDISEDDSSLLDGDSSDINDPLAFDDSPDEMDLDIVDMAEGGAEMPQASAKAMPSEIFRAYDIRGIVGENLDEGIATSIGMAIGSEAISRGQTSIAIARDGRHSSGSLAEALAQGLLATGINVIDIGMLPTPMLYYATKTLSTQSGVVITGSHNPANYNGFKIVIADETLSGAHIQALKERIESGNFNQGEGSYETHDIVQDYKDRILNDVVLAKPMNIVVDCGNGVAGTVVTDILNNLGCSVTTLYGEVDGDFPNHHPDPSKPENLEPLIAAVQEQNAELGIAFDGDGDRLGIVTPAGKIIWPDRLLMLYARDLLSRNPGSDIIYDVKCSRDVAELVSNLGGRAIMCPTGHSLMKAKMAETGAVVGGELSGHIFFNDRWYGFDDAIYSAARLLEILSMEPFGADEVFAEFPEKVSTPELSVAIDEEKKFAVMNRLTEQGQFSDGNMVTLDGIRVDYPDGWGLVRASNTTPNLVARFEADSEEALERIKGIFRQQLQAADASINVEF